MPTLVSSARHRRWLTPDEARISSSNCSVLESDMLLVFSQISVWGYQLPVCWYPADCSGATCNTRQAIPTTDLSNGWKSMNINVIGVVLIYALTQVEVDPNLLATLKRNFIRQLDPRQAKRQWRGKARSDSEEMRSRAVGYIWCVYVFIFHTLTLVWLVCACFLLLNLYYTEDGWPNG